ncbi:CAP domain-containing protein [Caulobacter hibisci]|uniref:CAP domain-containing protein n=1 Tax=Caulobacter hibisci TaxID=2035993 RepID=A0ABS0T104_9CAUL|nr:CAP domain-containing protein [Caulobacter hibisci]MBI1685364.1 CAP domain-containing protein [Caulobacter hibisci]
MSALSRRTALALGAASLVLPGLAQAASAQAYLAYDRRLRDQLAARRGDFDADFERELQDQGDAQREARRLSPLTFDPGLALAARAHAADIARTEVYDHMTREGFGPAARVGLLARDLVGAPAENIALRRNAAGAVRPDQIMGQWKSSPGHRANLLAPGFTHVGYAALRDGPEVIAVGVYAEVSARLAAPAPLRATSVEAIAAALSRASPRIDQFSLSDPGGEVLTQTYVERPQPVTIPSGAWQLRPHLSSGAHRYQVAWGPVVVLG